MRQIRRIFQRPAGTECQMRLSFAAGAGSSTTPTSAGRSGSGRSEGLTDA